MAAHEEIWADIAEALAQYPEVPQQHVVQMILASRCDLTVFSEILFFVTVQ
jgi:hypothetical protein